MLEPVNEPGEYWFPTDNIKLAAILCTLGFQFKSGMSVGRDMQEHTMHEVTRWYFDCEHQWGEDALTGAIVDNWFRNKAEFQAKYPNHPITWMRNGLDAREWLIKVKYGESKVAETGAAGTSYPTRDIKFAACLVVARYRLLKFADNIFHFWDDGRAAKHWAKFQSPFDPERDANPIGYIRACLLNRDDLAALARDKRCIPQILMKCKGRQVIISAQASRETKNLLFNSL